MCVLTLASLACSVALSVLLSSSFFSKMVIFSSLIFIVCWTVSSSRDSSSLYLLTYTHKRHQWIIHPSIISKNDERIVTYNNSDLLSLPRTKMCSYEKVTCPPVCALVAVIFLCSVQSFPALHWGALTQHSAVEHSASLIPTPGDVKMFDTQLWNSTCTSTFPKHD